MAISTYSPSDVSFKLYGMFEVTGFAANSFITIKKNGTRFETMVGAQGDVSRVHKPNDVYQITLSLAQSSFWNQILIAIHELDEATLVGKFPILISDGSGDSFFLSSTAWIDSVPDISYSNGMETRDWSFTCSDMVNNLAGNEETSTAAQVILAALAVASSTASGGIGSL